MDGFPKDPMIEEEPITTEGDTIIIKPDAPDFKCPECEGSLELTKVNHYRVIKVGRQSETPQKATLFGDYAYQPATMYTCQNCRVTVSVHNFEE